MTTKRKKISTVLHALAFPFSVFLILILGVFIFAGLKEPNVTYRRYGDTNVYCLPFGHDKIELAWTMKLSIKVDGKDEEVPANAGYSMGCTTELHTHANDGTIYIELYDKDRLEALEFGDVIRILGLNLTREGYAVSVRYNGTDYTEQKKIPLKNNASVELNYIRLPGATSTATTTQQ